MHGTQSPGPGQLDDHARLRACGRYLVFLAVASLVWELAQLPLYTIWETEPAAALLFAALHCTAGDVLIAALSLVAAIILLGGASWPGQRHGAVASGAIAAGLAYTIFSEWLNVEVRGAWSYRSQMPVLPLLGTGLSPLLQWLIVPALAFRWMRKPLRLH